MNGFDLTNAGIGLMAASRPDQRQSPMLGLMSLLSSSGLLKGAFAPSQEQLEAMKLKNMSLYPQLAQQYMRSGAWNATQAPQAVSPMIQRGVPSHLYPQAPAQVQGWY